MDKILLEKFKKYIDLYGSKYDPKAFEYIKDNFERFLDADKIPDILRQIYTALGIVKQENDFYLRHCKNIESFYGINSNIIEVGCGFYPALAKYIDDSQQLLGLGSIEAYDPLLVVDSLGKINLKPEEFNDKINVEACDLIFGIMPCEASEIIIGKANENGKNFYLALCGCVPFEADYGFYGHGQTLSYWYDSLYSLAERSLPMGKSLEMIYLPENYCCEYPIILSRDKK